MAEGDQADISEEVNPSVSVHSQPPLTHAPPPPTPAGVLLAYSSAPSTHLLPPTSLGAPLPQAPLTSSTSDDQARITALEGTVNQMAANMAELLTLLRGPNRASSSSTPPPGQGSTVDPAPGIPPTQAPKNMDAPAPTNAAYLHGSTFHQPRSATAGPHGRPSSTGGIPHFRSGLIRATACFHAGPGYRLYSPSADGFPDLRGSPVPPLSHFFPGPSRTIGGTLDGPSSDFDDTPATPSAVYAVTEEISSGVHIRLA
ncbi:hypothetical protein CDL15_Pgr017486 [Punica granatum]|uniref:Uncharacterized protein n=1 Tax=Punica granatum TaxID=22663 RepID=A0A218XJ62_PUNGR|nr:hypothetical protein CDL15_Pgr017486 [Punica granatum]